MLNNIVLCGVNHKTAPVEIREKIAFQENILRDALTQLKSNENINECLILSTCNRVEIYVVSQLQPEKIKDEIIKFISEFHKISPAKFVEHLYFYVNYEAIRHIFRVGSSLDSLVVGEPQIIGQLKDAYRFAVDTKTTGTILNKLLHRAFFVAKKVRTETEIANSAVSISFAAVELAKKIFESLDYKKILLIGAGEMCELAAKHLISNGANEIYVTNRTFERAVELAEEFKGSAVNFENRYIVMEKVDIIISSTGAPHFVVEYDEVKKISKNRKYKPLFMIDIAVPRDIDPKVNEIEGVYLYDIDDLKDIVERNILARKNEAEKAEIIVAQEAQKFLKWLESLDITPLIVEFREKFEKIAEEEKNKYFKRLNGIGDKEKEIINQMVNVIVHRILHEPSINLKNFQELNLTKTEVENVLKKIFNI